MFPDRVMVSYAQHTADTALMRGSGEISEERTRLGVATLTVCLVVYGLLTPPKKEPSQARLPAQSWTEYLRYDQRHTSWWPISLFMLHATYPEPWHWIVDAVLSVVSFFNWTYYVDGSYLQQIDRVGVHPQRDPGSIA
jgi:hypothetical protein